MKNNLVLYVGGIIFGFGLAYSGMAQPEVVLAFLQLKNLGLLLVLGFGVIVTAFTFFVFPKLRKKSLFGNELDVYSIVFSKKLIIGAIFFGIGWGLAGLCPGAAVAGFGAGNWKLIIGLLGILMGAYIQGFLEKTS